MVNFIIKRIIIISIGLLLIINLTNCNTANMVMANSKTITKENATSIAKSAFDKTGLKSKDYIHSVDFNVESNEWVVTFEKKADIKLPGDEVIILVNKLTGKFEILRGQ